MTLTPPCALSSHLYSEVDEHLLIAGASKYVRGQRGFLAKNVVNCTWPRRVRGGGVINDTSTLKLEQCLLVCVMDLCKFVARQHGVVDGDVSQS